MNQDDADQLSQQPRYGRMSLGLTKIEQPKSPQLLIRSSLPKLKPC